MPLRYNPVIMFDIELTGVTYYVATQTIYYGGTKYSGCVLPGTFNFAQQMPELFYGIRSQIEFSFDMENIDDGVNSTWNEIQATKEFRGRYVKVQVYDPDNDVSPTFLGYGKINQTTSSEKFRIEVSSRDTVLETIVPKGIITTDLFHATARDLGLPINICFGHCRDVHCPNIRWDDTNKIYDFLVGYGTIEGIDETPASNLGVKRAGIIAATSTQDADGGYYIYDGAAWIRGDGTTEATVYGGGYAFIRWRVDQMSHSKGFDKVTTDVKGLELGGATANRNFATVIYHFLTNATWGLGQTADAASFATAATTLSNANNFYCDGAIAEQQAAEQVLMDLLMPARAWIERASDKEWEITIDAAGASVKNVGSGDEHYENFTVESLSDIPANNIVSIVKAHYDMRENNVGEDNLAYKKIAHTIDAAFGVEQVYELPFVLEDVTAKKVVSYVTNRTLNSNRYLTGKGDASWSAIRRGQIVTVTVPRLNITAVTYMVQEINYDFQGKFDVVLRPYSADIYNDVVLSTPTAWTPTSGYGSIYEVPYVTVSPTPGLGMFTTIDAALANLPYWARRIVLLKGTHTAPSTDYTMPDDRDLDIVGESRTECIVKNTHGAHQQLFHILDSEKSYRFENFTITSQNAGQTYGAAMIKPWSSSGNNAATVVVRNMIFNLAHASDYGVMDLIRYAGKLEISNCVFNITAGMAVYSDYCDNTWIVNNIIDGGAIQVRLYGVTESANIISNRFLNFTSYGIKAEGGLYSDLRDIVISSNVFESSEANAIRGVHAKYVDNCQIKGNIIKLTAASLGSPGGVYVEQGHRIVVESNDIYIVNADVGNSFGVYFNTVNRSSIDKNIIKMDQTGAARYAIAITDGSSVVDGCTIEGNKIDCVNNRATYDIGIYLGASASNNEGANNVTKYVAVPLYDGGSGNNVTGNDEGTPF